MRFSWKISITIALIATFTAGSLGWPGAADADSSVVLAEDYPYASMFLGMARRGAEDYASRHDAFPATLADMVVAGYTAYEFPAAFSPTITVEADQYLVTSGGRAEYTGGCVVEAHKYGATAHHGDLYIEQELYILPNGDADEEHVLQQVKVYFFCGAEWLDNGFSWDTVERGQRFDRVVTHLKNASVQFDFDNRRMPTDLTELEAYVGLERNPAGWDGITIVDSLAEVDNAPGNLFIGWADEKWVISCNLGPETSMFEFWQLDGGNWVGTGGIAY